MTGFYGGFAIFGVLGYMFSSKCVDSFSEVAADGPELAFVVYPEGLSLMGSVAPLFSILFFAMMLLLGLGSQVNC
jgi:SNF family Na+-dependent transporter